MGDIGLLMQHIITTIEQLYQQLKQVKRRLPLDPNATNLGLNKEIFENLYHCYQHAGKIMKTLQDVVKNAVQIVTTGGGMIQIICILKCHIYKTRVFPYLSVFVLFITYHHQQCKLLYLK